MTREEAITKYIVPAIERTWNDKKCKEILEALEQEPCEDEYIKIPKKALKYRIAGMIAYNAEWLKNHFDIERAVICGAQEQSGDLISRDAVLEQTYLWSKDEFLRITNPFDYLRKRIKNLPPVNPQPKTGHWIHRKMDNECWEECSECHVERAYPTLYCPDCGARMESEE